MMTRDGLSRAIICSTMWYQSMRDGCQRLHKLRRKARRLMLDLTMPNGPSEEITRIMGRRSQPPIIFVTGRPRKKSGIAASGEPRHEIVCRPAQTLGLKILQVPGVSRCDAIDDHGMQRIVSNILYTDWPVDTQNTASRLRAGHEREQYSRHQTLSYSMSKKARITGGVLRQK